MKPTLPITLLACRCEMRGTNHSENLHQDSFRYLLNKFIFNHRFPINRVQTGASWNPLGVAERFGITPWDGELWDGKQTANRQLDFHQDFDIIQSPESRRHLLQTLVISYAWAPWKHVVTFFAKVYVSPKSYDLSIQSYECVRIVLDNYMTDFPWTPLGK